MAKVTGSPFGRVLGESLGVVGGQWKGIDYVRKYVVPANPKTPAQELQRAKFKNISDFGRRLVDTVLNPYTLPKPKQQSAFNKFISVNVPLQTTDTLVRGAIKLTTGALYLPTPALVVAPGGAAASVSWATTIVGEANANDVIHQVYWIEATDTYIYDNALRSAGIKVTTISPAAPVGSVVHAYAFAVGVNGNVTSDSWYGVFTVTA